MPHDPIERNRTERRLAWLILVLLVALCLLPGLLRTAPRVSPPLESPPATSESAP